MRADRVRPAAVFLIGLAVSALLLWIAGRNTDPEAVLHAIRQVNPAAVLPFTVCLLVFYVVRTYRWKILLSPISEVHTRSLLGPVMIGYGANFVLPFQLGEVVRILAAVDRAKLPFMPIAFSILVERVFDFLIILAALSIALFSHDNLPESISSFGLIMGLAVATGIVLLTFFVVKTEGTLTALRRFLAFLPTGIHESLIDQLRLGANGLQSLRSTRVLGLSALASVVQWSLIGLCIWISLLAVGVAVPIATVMLILALIVLGSSIPTAPGYLGSFQAGYVLGLEALGGDPAQALTASIFYHVIYAITAVGFGILAVRSSGLSWRMLTDKKRAA